MQILGCAQWRSVVASIWRGRSRRHPSYRAGRTFGVRGRRFFRSLIRFRRDGGRRKNKFRILMRGDTLRAAILLVRAAILSVWAAHSRGEGGHSFGSSGQSLGEGCQSLGEGCHSRGATCHSHCSDSHSRGADGRSRSVGGRSYGAGGRARGGGPPRHRAIPAAPGVIISFR